MMDTDKNQNGNVIWLVLLVVALLAFLTSVVSRNTSSLNQSGDIERIRIGMSNDFKYAQSIEFAIQRLQINNGCSENELSFENDLVTGYENTNSPSDQSCHIFKRAGAGLTWQSTGYDEKTWVISSNGQIDQNPTNSNDDIILILRDVSEDFCLQANRDINEWTEIPDWNEGDGDLWTLATGSYGTSGLVLSLPSTSAWGENFTSGCFNNTQQNEYDFFHTVLIR